ncbi:Ti-type conjugative transfer relaxase TraA [Acidisoma sp. L85]|uniref:Ti-type conjugative transfer relaxase TraA n=1 Tax=Acidisoma sp. L85 TaxID=1641850 RepID=UPI00131A99D2|nr:Ti-type conjugative transfer relaxase TraA [Acidisoma sp. L85]
MAIYHFSAKVIGRSGGRSAIASAAYRAGERLHDDKRDRNHDYSDKAGVVHREIMLPDGAPARWADRGTLWNEVEAGEKRKDAQLARDIEISLPRELGKAEAIRLAQDFVHEQFVARGMVADLNVHWTQARDGGEQPHAHVMLTMREVLPGLGALEGKEEGAFGKKVIAWNDRGLLTGWRERWAELANARLLELGHDIRIDHRSYAEQGIELEPQHKIGPVGTYREDERQQQLERAAEHREIARRNGDKLLDEPAIALRALTQQHSTFTRQELARFVDRHTDGAAQFSAVMTKVEAAPELVRLGQDGRGRDRFTTQDMLDAERRMERAARLLSDRDGHRVLQVAGWRAVKAAERGGLVLEEEQRAAFKHVTSGPDLSLVVGYAGSGKSTMLGVARATWEAEGFQVRGLALSGIAAEGLEKGSRIASRTIASLEYAWKEGREPLTRQDVLVIDEAGMIGSRQMERVLSAAQAAGAKVVLIGDPEQLQAIEAGAAFRALAERHGAAEITTVRRQHEAWQREATRELATGRTEQALARYAAAGMVVASDTRAEARGALVASWDAARRQQPEESRVILAYTRADVRDLNDLARAQLRAAGELRMPDQVVQTERGARAFAAGDRIMFQRNERGLGGHDDRRDGVAVKNGSLGTVLAIDAEGQRFTVRLDGAAAPGQAQGGNVREVTFALGDYAHIDHGYAATVHKAQGVTVDRAHVLVTPHMDRHAAYVGLTRHRDGVALHYAQEDFADLAKLTRALSRERAKDTSLDYDRDREGDELSRRYAERRGLDPLRPESAIVVREVAHQPEREATTSTPRRSRFTGLKLRAEQDTLRQAEPVRQTEPVTAMESLPRTTPEIEREERLRGALTAYAVAWADAGRMTAADLPVLAHQAEALERAEQRLEALAPNLPRDARAALERAPELARDAATPDGMAALGTAISIERRARLNLDERGRAAVRTWDTLERAYEAAEKEYDWKAQRKVGARMEAFAKELKCDLPLDRLLRQRGRELGVDKGSRLDQVVQAREADVTRTLRRELGISRGRDMGMSL